MAKTFWGTLIFLCSMAALCFAQPSWVKDVIDQGQNITTHKNASAIVLHYVTELEISKSGDAKSKSQIAYKILTRDGTNFGTISLPLAPFLKVKGLKGWTVKADGSVKSLSDKDVIQVSTQESAGYYDDSHILLGRLPEVEPGVTIAFETETEEKGWTSLYQQFVFQIQQPVKFAKYQVKLPNGWQLISTGWNTEGIEFKQHENLYTWIAQDLKYQEDEPLSPSWYFLSRRVAINCFDPQKKSEEHFDNWKSVADWVTHIHYQQAIPNNEVTEKAQELINGSTSFEDKVRAIASFNQNDVRYVGIEIGKERWQPRAAEKTLFNRYGDCKDKTTLMRAMLHALNIPSAPVLASVNYPVNPHLPTPFQFDHCIIAIPLEGNQISPKLKNAVVNDWLFFDPTDPTIELGELPWALQGRRVMLGAPKDSVLFQLPYPEPADFKRLISADAFVNSDGSFSADVKIIDLGGFASQSRYEIRTTPENEQIDYWRIKISEIIPNITLSGYQAGVNEDSVWSSFTIRGERIIQKAGSLILLKPDIFSVADPSPLTAKERQHPVWFGPPMEIITSITWHLPENWDAEVDTTAFESQCEGASIYSKMSLADHVLQYQSIEQQNGKLVMPEDYQSAQKYAKDLSYVNGQTILIKGN